MHIFLSAGEPSGDLHGANLAREFRRRDPSIRLSGFGGPRMREAGCDLLYPLVDLAVMWFLRVLWNIRTFLGLLKRAETFFAEEKPDAVVMIDYPGFHWKLAERAKAQGIPVIYFVPPQIWAWAGWRVEKVRRSIDHVLCTLPFEEAWYRERDVTAVRYVGHPYFDELAERSLDATFMARQQSRVTPLVTLLPGSRGQEVSKNLPTMLAAAQKIHASVPATRFAIACYNEAQKAVAERMVAKIAVPIEIHTGRTPELIAAATSCIAVSGSVGLELLHHLKPAVVLYRMRRFDLWVGSFFIKSRFISLVNLLADEELYPEYLTCRDESSALAAHTERWLTNPGEREAVVAKLAALKQQVARPGACERAADAIQELVANATHSARAA
jgi:lipid-A-disaccharide synthase